MSDSISDRFFASLIASVLRAGISFSTGLLLARWLGPDDYGRMAFLLASFMAFKQLLDLGTSAAFFTFLSQRPRGNFFISLYWRWVGVQFLFSVGLVSLLLPNELLQVIWKGETRFLVVLALIATFMQGIVWQVASQMAEASRKTLQVQRLNTLLVFAHLLIVLALWIIGQLALPLLFAVMAFEWALGGWLAAKMYQHKNKEDFVKGDGDTLVSVWREFWVYCAPFIPYACLGFVHDFADRWMLQHWGGSKQQGYFAVAQLLSGAVLLATSSIIRIFWKEIADAHYAGDLQRVKNLYTKVSRSLYFFGAVLAGCLVPWTTEIIELTVGPAYLSGVPTLFLMLLYPVHQSLGQLGSTMLFATDHARVQVGVGMVVMSISLFIAYFMMAPEHASVPGLGMASKGLAWKMVLLQIVEVNVIAWYIARIFGWNFEWFYQLAGLVCCLLLGFSAQKLAALLLGDLSLALQFLIAGVFFLIGIISLLFGLPWLVDVKRQELLALMRRIIGGVSYKNTHS